VVSTVTAVTAATLATVVVPLRNGADVRTIVAVANAAERRNDGRYDMAAPLAVLG